MKKNISSVLLLFVGLILNAQSLNQVEIIQMIREGNSLVRLGNTEQAIFQYTNAIQMDVGYAPSYVKRGMLHEKLGNHQQALADYNMALSISPKAAIYYDHRSRLKFLMQNYEGALADIEQAVTIEPYNNSYLEHQMDLFIWSDRYDQVLRLTDSSRSTQFLQAGRAFSYIMLGQYAEAESTLDELQAWDHYLVPDLMGVLHLYRKNYDQAKAYFDLAIAKDSTQYLSFYNRAIAQRHLGNGEASLKDLNQAIALNQSQAKLFFMQALLFKDDGNFTEAVKAYDQAINEDSLYTEAIYNRAFTNKALGNHTSALLDINQLVGMDAEVPEYWNLKGNVYLVAGNYALAIEAYDEAIFNKRDFGEAYYNRGLAHLLMDQINEACSDFRTSIDLGVASVDEFRTMLCE